MPSRYRARRIAPRDGREVTQRAIVEADATGIVQAFERLSAQSRYYRFMQHNKQLDGAALQRGVPPRPGQDFAFVATIPADDTVAIVGAAQYVRAGDGDDKTCEFGITVAEDWRFTSSTSDPALRVRRLVKSCALVGRHRQRLFSVACAVAMPLTHPSPGHWPRSGLASPGPPG